jgi:hypothetical protein
MIYDMRMTFNIKDEIANDFLLLVPSRQRSELVVTLIQQAMEAKKKAIIKACIDANKDEETNDTIDDWQSFDTPVEGE